MNDETRKDVEDGSGKPKSQGLVPISQDEARQNKQALVLMSEQMEQMNARMESVRDMLQKLPGTIGAAVAEALSRPANASGPAIPLTIAPGDIEFGRGQGTRVGGKVITEGIPIKPLSVPKSKATGTRP